MIVLWLGGPTEVVMGLPICELWDEKKSGFRKMDRGLLCVCVCVALGYFSSLLST